MTVAEAEERVKRCRRRVFLLGQRLRLLRVQELIGRPDDSRPQRLVDTRRGLGRAQEALTEATWALQEARREKLRPDGL